MSKKNPAPWRFSRKTSFPSWVFIVIKHKGCNFPYGIIPAATAAVWRVYLRPCFNEDTRRERQHVPKWQRGLQQSTTNNKRRSVLPQGTEAICSTLNLNLFAHSSSSYSEEVTKHTYYLRIVGIIFSRRTALCTKHYMLARITLGDIYTHKHSHSLPSSSGGFIDIYIYITLIMCMLIYLI